MLRYVRYAVALSAIVAFAAWHALLGVFRRGEPHPAVDPADADLVEHERGWYEYVRGFHAHHGSTDGDRPEDGDFWRGLERWYESSCLRGYTLGNHVYLCPGTPRVVRVHQAGHAPSFAAGVEPLATERRADGGLEDEPLGTLDVMMPGRFPHTLLRIRDSRGLGDRYDRWVNDGRIARVSS